MTTKIINIGVVGTEDEFKEFMERDSLDGSIDGLFYHNIDSKECPNFRKQYDGLRFLKSCYNVEGITELAEILINRKSLRRYE